MHKILKFFYYTISYGLCLAVALSIGFIFQPFIYVDNDHSYIRCNGEEVSYETSPNLIFGLDAKLDPSNDSKARKLCQYKIINDYIDMYQVPKDVNYEFLPAYLPKSSWPQAIFVAILTFMLGSAIIESVGTFLKLDRSPFAIFLINNVKRIIL